MTTTAGELRPVDIGRPIEIGAIKGRLRAFHANGQEVILWVAGDPHWPAKDPIDLGRDHWVTLGDHPEASRR